MNKKSHDEETKKKISRSLKQAYKKNQHPTAKAVAHIPTGQQFPSGKEAAKAHNVSAGTVFNHCQMKVDNPEFRYVNYKAVRYIVDKNGDRYQTLQEAADNCGYAVSTVQYHIKGKPPVHKRKFTVEYEFMKKE